MTFHALTEYLKYTWNAKGRHGTHSPFVYDLVERVLLDKEVIDKVYIVTYPSLPLRYENLISRIASYYKYKYVLRLPAGDNENVSADMLLLNDMQPGLWVELVDKYAYLLSNESAIIAVGIHKTKEHTKQWLKLCANPNVRMSIDVYGLGLLFFKEEFKERQQFVLKY